MKNQSRLEDAVQNSKCKECGYMFDNYADDARLYYSPCGNEGCCSDVTIFCPVCLNEDIITL